MRQLRALALRDELTGLLNRRELQNLLQNEWLRAVRFKRPFSLGLADIDHFKRVNDEYGHPVGDRVIRHVGQVLETTLRRLDRVARFGGEEFAILMPETGRREAAIAMERVRVALAQSPCPVPEHGPRPGHHAQHRGLCPARGRRQHRGPDQGRRPAALCGQARRARPRLPRRLSAHAGSRHPARRAVGRLVVVSPWRRRRPRRHSRGVVVRFEQHLERVAATMSRARTCSTMRAISRSRRTAPRRGRASPRGVAALLNDGRRPLVLGGDHSITYPILRALGAGAFRRPRYCTSTRTATCTTPSRAIATRMRARSRA